jgi:enoyl-CoA hydratase/carnithine racemase
MPVTTSRLDHILVIRLDRADKRNAIDTAMTVDLDATLNVLDDDEDLWVGVLTAEGPVFSAGTDLKSGAGTTDRGGEYGIIRRTRRKPLIAAVDGMALGGGFEIVLACDLVVAGRQALFGFPEVRRGVIASSGALFRAPRALPLNIAKELLVTGEPMDAERAAGYGLVNRVTEPGEALEEALRLARQICANAPVSVRETLRAVDRAAAAQDSRDWAFTAEAVEVVRASADMAEGVSAFFEKRPPRWAGR